jgi:two-component system, NarL family, sensor histidine kinase UhpB
MLRASFRPLFALLATIRAISSGKTQARARVSPSDAEIGELAQAFNGMLDRLEISRREQAGLILQAQEEERRRLALELHDESSQNLTALLVHIEILSQGLQAEPTAALTRASRARLAGGLEYLAGLSQRTLENIRILAQQLRPSVLDDLGLCAALRWLAEDGRQRLHLSVQLDLDEVEEALHTRAYPTSYETALFRIAQEGLTNVARHAHARHACLALGQDAGHISLVVRDDGCGYDPARHHEGLGIFGMRERAMLLGGTIDIQARPGHGTTVQATLPWPAPLIEEVKNV